jgi:large subunit ribosomal protein L28e
MPVEFSRLSGAHNVQTRRTRGAWQEAKPGFHHVRPTGKPLPPPHPHRRRRRSPPCRTTSSGSSSASVVLAYSLDPPADARAQSQNSFLVKRVPEGPIFSKEPVRCDRRARPHGANVSNLQGNLLNVHSEKYSGLSNARTLHVADTGSGVVILSRKPKASPHAVKGAYARTAVRARSGGRRHAGVVSGFAKRGYRADLRKVRLSPSPLPFFLVLERHGGHRRRLEPTGRTVKAGRREPARTDRRRGGTDQAARAASRTRYRSRTAACPATADEVGDDISFSFPPSFLLRLCSLDGVGHGADTRTARDRTHVGAPAGAEGAEADPGEEDPGEEEGLGQGRRGRRGVGVYVACIRCLSMHMPASTCRMGVHGLSFLLQLARCSDFLCKACNWDDVFLALSTCNTRRPSLLPSN